MESEYLFLHVVVPVMIVIFAGYVFGRFTSIDHSAISKFAMLVLSPALIFSSLSHSSLSSAQMVQIIATILLFTVIMTVITIVTMRLTGNEHYVNAALLSTVFPNTGNYGLPVLLFAYGEKGFSMGVIAFVISFILMYSLGVYFASLEGSSWKQGLRNVLKLPSTYAAVLAALVNMLNIPIPDYIFSPIKLVGSALIPVVLLILGIQLSKTRMKGNVRITIISSSLKMIVAPLITFAIIYAMGIGGLLAKVLVLQNSMPTAVVMTIVANQYKARSEIVANVTFLTTLISFFTITGLLYLLQSLYG